MEGAEVTPSGDLVERLVAAQHPDLADEVPSPSPAGEGWDNVTFRIGSAWAARLPRRAEAVPFLLNEQRWLPELSVHLPVETPGPARIGRPSSLFPWPWSIVRWIEGAPADVEPLGEGEGDRLATVLRALHRRAPAEAPVNPYRGVPLRVRAEWIEERLPKLESLGPEVVEELREAWRRGVAAPGARRRTWLHGDLHPRNVLVREGALVGLIDWGDLNGGDPATDLAAAWTLLRSDEERGAFRDRYGAGEAEWLRARAWAVLFATALCTGGDGGHRSMGRIIVGQIVGGAREARVEAHRDAW